MANFWCRAASAALCVALSTNMMEVSAIDTSQDPFESSTIEGGGDNRNLIIPLLLQPSRNQTKQNCANTIIMTRTAATPRTTPDAALSAPSALWKSRLTLFSN